MSRGDNETFETAKPRMTVEFSWQEWLDRFKTPSNDVEDFIAEKRTSRDHGEWRGYVTFKGALELANSGWNDGLALIKPLSSRLVDRVGSKLETHDISYDIEGASIDIGRYLDGEPECWQKFETREIDSRGNRVIRMAYNFCVSGGIDAEIIKAKGAAMVALIEALELGGARVELTMVWPRTQGSDNGEIGYLEKIRVKESDQPLDLARLAYILAHPSFLRVLGFVACEYMPRDMQSKMGAGFGYPISCPKLACLADYDMYFAGSFLGEPEWKSPESAEAWIVKVLRENGIEVSD